MSVGNVYDGPLDLLLDLIRKQDIDIYDIPIAQITAQYLAYVEHIRNFDIDLAAEFIYTASAAHSDQVQDAVAERSLTRRRTSRIRDWNWSIGCSSTNVTSRPRRCFCRSSRLKRRCSPIPR